MHTPTSVLWKTSSLSRPSHDLLTLSKAFAIKAWPALTSRALTADGWKVIHNDLECFEPAELEVAVLGR